MTDRRLLRQAVLELAKDPAPAIKVQALEAVGALARRYPVELVGSFAHLNPLVRVFATDAQEYERVKEAIDVRRVVEGLAPCWPKENPVPFRERKNKYQRQLMARIRERARRASEIENMQRLPHQQLIGHERLEFQRYVTNEWGRRRDALIEATDPPTRAHISAVRDAFWAEVDAELDRREQAVRLELLKPPSKRRKI